MRDAGGFGPRRAHCKRLPESGVARDDYSGPFVRHSRHGTLRVYYRRVHCEGFLPRKEGARKKRMEQLCDEPVPVVMLESPYRCLKVLAELNILAPERDLFLARELTKLHEECLWGTVADIYRRLTERHTGDVAPAVRGEIVMVLAPAGRPKRETEISPKLNLP